MFWCQASSDISIIGQTSSATPALLKRMSTLPSSACACSAARCTAAASATSTARRVAGPSAASSATAASSFFRSRPHSSTRAPDCRKRFALASPMPLPPPVTTAVCPARSIEFMAIDASSVGAYRTHVKEKCEPSGVRDFPRCAIGVVGPGLMGLGLCHLAGAAGCAAVLVGRDATAARRGLERLASDLDKRVLRGRLGASDRDRILGAVSAAPDDRALAHCGLVVEAVAEDRVVKAEVLRRIEAVVAPDALIATNTSGLPIAGLATALEHPGRFIGLHFFSPVDRMALVEVVVGDQTAAATTDAALDWVRRLGKKPIVVRDSPGFFTSRIFSAYLDEAMVMLAEGVAPTLIEAAATSAGMPIGPLAMLDETGLALNWQQARQAKADGLADRFCRTLAWPVLDRMVSLARRGRRDGGGFYD